MERTMLLLLCIWLNTCSTAALAQEHKDVALCTINCVAPMTTPESEDVIDVLKAITRALADRNFTTMAGYLDANCTTYDAATHKLVVGRDAIISDVKAKVEAEEHRLKVPPIAFTIDRPYAKVSGDEAVVTFVLIKEIGGAHPTKYQSHCSDVFVKRDGQWKKLHYCGDNWKLVK